MKKSLYFFLAFILTTHLSYSQQFAISLDGKKGSLESTFSSHTRDVLLVSDNEEVNILFIKVNDGTNDNSKFYEIENEGSLLEGAQKIKNDGNFHKVTFPEKVFDVAFKIFQVSAASVKTGNGIEFSPIFKPAANSSSNGNPSSRTTGKVVDEIPTGGLKSIWSTVNSIIINERYELTKFGYEEKSKGIVHIFLNQFGGSIGSAMPQGSSTKKYMVHIIYLDDKNNPTNIYSIEQTSGGFYGGIIFENDEFQQESATLPKWYESRIALTSSNSDDISFTVSRSDIGSGVTEVVASHTIKIAKSYNVTINAGFIESWVTLPSYDMYYNPSNDVNTVIESTSKQGLMTTVSATLYASIPYIITNLLNKNSSDSENDVKMVGRNFFDDHKIYERIYPTVGIKLGENGVNNFLGGLSWEFARGASLFGGVHVTSIDKFKTAPLYSSGEEFIFGETEISQEDFDIRFKEDGKTAVDFAVGLNLDLRLLLSLRNTEF